VVIAPSRLLLAFASKYSVASALWRLSQNKGRRLQETRRRTLIFQGHHLLSSRLFGRSFA